MSFKVTILAEKASEAANLSLGGQSRIAHYSQERVYLDKQCYDRGTVKWVAFHSDCEHEVLPITVECRVTLTYQLFASEGTGGLVQSCI